ncbi:hypothetical protein [Mesorhizobium muleiense]|uniref:Uncharacterized protein n=1 Tax=Mesorhizobium muleiense TaxID=1004279 RepID=A0A1G8LCK6_9HYPH|nr:hypothetical protein [Mesorhizobium muleiense]MCF6100357.1 hypothetical protein [Mesorhizobium muleiense]SDI53353.1 hypothetical protein SAMN05428953_102205 [Mesorhizobium muleiense]
MTTTPTTNGSGQPNGHAQPTGGPIISKRMGHKPTPIQPPAALDGRNILHFGDAAAPDVALTLMAGTLDAARSAVEKAVTARSALLQDVNLTEQARHLKIKQAVIQTIGPQVGAIDKRIEAVQGEIAKIKLDISAPKFSPLVQDNFVQQAIINRLASMKPAERSAVLSEALSSGDDRTLGIVLSSPAWLSGLSQNEHDHLKARFGLKRHGEQVRRVQRLEKALEAMERARASVESFAAGLFNQQLANEAEAAAERTARALAKE